MPEAIREVPSSGQDMARFTKQTILGATFEATERYTQLVPIEFGTSGLSCAARDQICNQNVAVKKLTGVFKTEATAKRMFGEIKLLKQLRHENITNLLDIFMAPSEDIYLVTDLMSTDLHTLLKSMKLEGQSVQFFTYQIMRGLKYVHSVGVVHRDLKPSSILVNENCDLKICDFGLTKETQVTDYASTGYYRAPETIMPWREYTEKADVWSAGCIFAEMITGNTLPPGNNHIDQIRIIAQWLGNPPKDFPANIINQKTLNFIHSLPKREPNPMSNFIPGADANATALLGEMLQIDPRKRVSAANALTSQYFAPYQDVADESTATKVFDWTFLEANLPVDIWKTFLYAEVFGYHASHTQGGSEN